MREARDFLRAPVFLCIAPFWTALSMRDELLVLARDLIGVTGLDRGLETTEMRL